MLGEKSYENILIYISYETFMSAKLLRIRFDEVYKLLKFMMELDIENYLVLGRIIQSLTELLFYRLKK